MGTDTKKIQELLHEAENLEILALGFTYEHQKGLRNSLILKASILREIAKDKLSEITNGKVILVDGESGSEEAIKTILMNKETHTPVIIVERQKPIPIMKAPPIPIFEFESGLTKSQRLAIIKPVGIVKRILKSVIIHPVLAAVVKNIRFVVKTRNHNGTTYFI